MEIKVECDCGQKYKFDVEPANGCMPFPVHCPACGAEGTAKANAIIRQSAPAAVRYAPLPAPAPPAPAPTPPPAIAIRRVERPASPAAATVAAAEPGEDETDGAVAGVHEFKLGWKVWLWVGIALVVGLISFGEKWYKRVEFIKDVVQFVKGVGSDSAGDAGSASSGDENDWTLPNDDGTMVLVRSDDHRAVAQACAEYYQAKAGKSATVSTSTNTQDLGPGAGGLIHPAHNHCVEIDGPMMWDEKATALLTGLSQNLSMKLATTSVCALMGDDAEGGVFDVYEKGERKFHCERWHMIKNGDLEEVIKVEGDAWATSTGFKPGEGGYKGFTMDDANALTHHLGLNLTKRPEATQVLVLQSTP
jgi:hypothetical protein